MMTRRLPSPVVVEQDVRSGVGPEGVSSPARGAPPVAVRLLVGAAASAVALAALAGPAAASSRQGAGVSSNQIVLMAVAFALVIVLAVLVSALVRRQRP